MSLSEIPYCQNILITGISLLMLMANMFILSLADKSCHLVPATLGILSSSLKSEPVSIALSYLAKKRNHRDLKG